MSEPSRDAVGGPQQTRASSASWTLRDASRIHGPTLPPEIKDYIINFLHDDKASLRQCSLVCRDWVPSSSYHLFETLWWPPCYHARYDHINWHEEQCRCATLDSSNFWTEFVRFIEGSQRVRDHVRALVIVFNWILFDMPGPRKDGGGVIEHKAKVALGEFANGLDKLPQLRCLDLHAPNFLPEAALVSSTTRSTRIPRELTLEWPGSLVASNEAVKLLVALLRQFGRISILQIKDVMKARTRYRPPSSERSECFRVAIAAVNFDLITTLVIRDIASGFDQRMPPLPRISLPNLRTLVLGESSALQLLDKRTAELYPRLRTLTVTGEVYLDSPSPRTNWLGLRSAAEWPMPSVEELLVQLPLYGSDEDHMPADNLRRSLEALDCTTLDAIIHAYRRRTVRLEIRVLWTRLPLSAAVRLVEDVVRDRLSETASTCMSADANDFDGLVVHRAFAPGIRAP